MGEQMNKIKLIIILLSYTFLSSMSLSVAAGQVFTGEEVLIENIRIIDGRGNAPVDAQDVLVSKGEIARIAGHGSFEVSADIKRINGEGLTLMPGLIDAHSHIFMNRESNWRKGLNERLYSGITTVHNVGGVLDFEMEVKEILSKSDEPFPSVSFSGYILNGNTEHMDFTGGNTVSPNTMVFSMTSNQDVIESLDKHQAAGIEMVKVYNQLPLRRLEFLVEEAHKRGMRVLIDATRAIGTVAINRTGVDGHAHPPYHFPASKEEIEDLRQRGIWVISTLVVIEFMGSIDDYPLVAEPEYAHKEPLITAFYDEEAIRNASTKEAAHAFMNAVKSSFVKDYGESFIEDVDSWMRTGTENVKRFFNAGILMGMGTDATAEFALRPPGWMLHYEMELWNEADIAPIKAIQAATYNNARILRIDDKTGSVAEGLEADLLIVSGNPAVNIKDSRNVKYVFLDGKLVDRQSLLPN